MLTIFSVPKAFAGHTAIIQDNAIGSWTRLAQPCDIVLFGDDPGVAEAAVRHKVQHEPRIGRNEFGTPVIADLFARMDALARRPLLAFVNADIILLDDFLPAVEAIVHSRRTPLPLIPAQAGIQTYREGGNVPGSPLSRGRAESTEPALPAAQGRFLAVASRFNCRIDAPLAFEPGWDARLRARARKENRMYPAAGSDLFVYPRGLFAAVPPFAIGRGYWDNWLMREARRRGGDLIDMTAAVTAVHHVHTYDTVAGLPAGGASDSHVYETEEGRRNLALAGGRARLYTVYDANRIMRPERTLRPAWRPSLFFRPAKASLRRLRARLQQHA
ncbi:MAG TPA: hypothetical protein VFL51_11865 [Pseudolabrys sp.]|nr:hypothetical protein [Pseudolabrys sp.]